jgi:hypothetical protein
MAMPPMLKHGEIVHVGFGGPPSSGKRAFRV